MSEPVQQSDLFAIAQALDDIADGTPVEEVPALARAGVLSLGGSQAAATLAFALVQAIRKGGGRGRG